MKQKILLILGISFYITSYSQVGINTAKPQGVFHVDGAKDNPKTTSAPTTTQQANDVVILQKSGYVGSGTTSPATNLEINNQSTNGAVKITDGNEGAGKYLMSDNDGVGTWITPNSFKSPIIWKYNGTPQQIAVTGSVDSSGWYLGSNNRTYSNLSLSGLTSGKWIINVGMRLSTSAPLNKAFWIHANISSSSTSRTNTGWSNLGPAGNSTGYASIIYGDGTANGKGFFTGTTIIDVSSATPISLYLLMENTGEWVFDTSSSENFFFAIPVN